MNKKSTSEVKIDIVLSALNESKNIEAIINLVKDLVSLLPIEKLIFVDNGSSDQTFKKLDSFKKRFPELIILQNPPGSSYSEGVLRGLKSATSEYFMSFHTDLQYDPKSFVIENEEIIKNALKNKKNIVGKRTGRPLVDAFFGLQFKLWVMFYLKIKLFDYNGQPRIIQNKLDIEKLEILRGFGIDAGVCSQFDGASFIEIPVKEKRRNVGASSWNASIFSRFLLAKSYVRELKKIKNSK